jgi:SAM-dependent methyltransferase
MHKKSFKNVIEIGVLGGGSIKLWHDFFENATIYGVDINLNNIRYNFASNNRVTLIQGDINNDDILNSLPPSVDIIIDDGSHLLEDQINTYKKLFPLLRPGGIYIIEDIQNINKDRDLFLDLHPNAKIHDFRHIKNRYDDVIVEIVKTAEY